MILRRSDKIRIYLDVVSLKSHDIEIVFQNLSKDSSSFNSDVQIC